MSEILKQNRRAENGAQIYVEQNFYLRCRESKQRLIKNAEEKLVGYYVVSNTAPQQDKRTIIWITAIL